MKERILLFISMMCLCTIKVLGGGYLSCSYGNAHNPGAGKTTLLSPLEDQYDIKHIGFRLSITDTATYIAGDVTTTAQVVAGGGMIQYAFELDTLLTVDSAKINGILHPITHTGNVRIITLPSPIAAGAMFSAEIFYHGTPRSGSGFFNGITHAISPGGTHMVFTVSDPWVALAWWPAKQSILDKVDSVDMYVSVPSGVADGSNGVLMNIDKTSTPGYWEYHWQTHYPIAYYLISISVARYSEYRSYWHFTGSTDSVLIQNFFMDTASFNPANKPNFDSIGQIMDYFSTLIGRYPFWKEKYGVCYSTLGGGMEHQTMTTIGVPNTYIIAHELMHQWFGDNVTYKTWPETWLSEGFATYSEQLFLERFWGADAAKAHRLADLNAAFALKCGMIYVNDTSTSDSLFEQKTVYRKAQGIVSMLRHMAPADSLFFKALRIYQGTYALGNAGTRELNDVFNSVYKTNLDNFFQQWIYGRGYPQYNVTWNQDGSTILVNLVQSTSCSYTSHFDIPIEIQLHATTGDTSVWLYNTQDTELFTINWKKTVSSVLFNPNGYSICRQLGVVKQDSTLGITLPGMLNYRIFPNPSGNHWKIEQLPEDTGLTLTDMNGRILWQGRSGKGITIIPGDNLPAGCYFLQLNGATLNEHIKLAHW